MYNIYQSDKRRLRKEMKRGITMLVFFLGINPAYAAMAEFLPGYPDYDEMMAEVASIVDQRPDLVKIVEYGESLQGRPLVFLHISRDHDSGRPGAMICGNIHGNEMIGNRMAIAIAKRLVQDDGRDPWITSILDKMDFWINPCVNPDGFNMTAEMAKAGDFRGHRKNANEVDLNRNFTMPGKRKLKIAWAGSPDPASSNYHGPHQGSEPEVQALEKFLYQQPVFASINYHSVVGVLFPARCTSRCCVKRIREMGKAYQDHQPNLRYTYVRWPKIFDSFTGEMEDLQYWEHGTLAIDIEIGRPNMNRKDWGRDESFFSFNPKNIEFWIENDRDAAIHAMERAYQITGGKPIAPRERCLSRCP
jgi:hypothetical protein